MKFSTLSAGAIAALSLIAVGCQSGRNPEVTSNYHAQWIDVSADVETTTAAAKQVFADDKLTDVSSQADKVRGEASGVLADKTKVWASVKKTDTGSQVSVQVGKVGNPTVGADYAVKIKQIAEKK
ncbi:MAG: hypothetical protein QM754_09015 [Tepidisphaeraceae bacterium]